MSKRSTWVVVGVGVVLSLFLAGFVSYYASGSPDGLLKVAGDQGFLANAQDSATANLPTAGYGIAGVDSSRLSGGLAGVLGVLVIAIIGFGMFWLIGRSNKSKAPKQDSGQVSA
jgi:hypothetical protein